MNDLRHAVRALVKQPGFTAVVVLTLALGIGANTTVFSAVYAVLLSGPPYEQPDQLRVIQPIYTRPGNGTDTLIGWPYRLYQAFRAANAELPNVATYTRGALPFHLAGSYEPQRATVEFVSQSYFDILRVRPALGRTFVPDEDRTPGTHPVAVLSHAMWRVRWAPTRESWDGPSS